MLVCPACKIEFEFGAPAHQCDQCQGELIDVPDHEISELLKENQQRRYRQQSLLATQVVGGETLS